MIGHFKLFQTFLVQFKLALSYLGIDVKIEFRQITTLKSCTRRPSSISLITPSHHCQLSIKWLSTHIWKPLNRIDNVGLTNLVPRCLLFLQPSDPCYKANIRVAYRNPLRPWLIYRLQSKFYSLHQNCPCLHKLNFFNYL